MFVGSAARPLRQKILHFWLDRVGVGVGVVYGIVLAENIAFSYRLGREGMGLCRLASLHGCKLSSGDVIWGALLCPSCSTLHGGK